MKRSDLCFRILKTYSGIWMRGHARVVATGLENIGPKEEGEKRVYLVLNHSTTYDAIALMHMAGSRVIFLMDQGAFKVPVVGKLLRGAGFVPLDKSRSEAAVQECIGSVSGGTPLLVSLHDGTSTLGQWQRPRTGGIRIAHRAGATLYPIFLRVEGRVKHTTIKGRDGSENPFTTFSRSLYFVEALPSIDLSALPKDATHEDYLRVAMAMDELRKETLARYEAQAGEERGGLFGALARLGGARFRISW
jgi:1-acyl-sn-glycerol-3-phosphate acyltransferase